MARDTDKRSFSDRFLKQSRKASAKTYLGKKQQRVEEITAEQAYNIAREDRVVSRYKDDMQKVQAPVAAVGVSSVDVDSSIDQK